jgi:acetyl-CoA carboxylase carboxyl transferase subunit beta
MSANWFQRLTKGIRTSQEEKKEVPEGLWYQCPKCKTPVLQDDHKVNLYVCAQCGHHERADAQFYFDLFFDTNRYKYLFENLHAADSLHFSDVKKYADRLAEAREKTRLDEALEVAVGKMGGEKVVIAAMNFSFIGGSMGSVVGEKISRAIDYCIEHKHPLIIISKSGGARMMESGLSLMQMVKTAAKLTQLSKARLPYVSLLTDPTTGGVTASFSMLGDINIAEPKALIGFAGPRVIMEAMKKNELPEGFQSSEFLLEHGFVDLIVERKDLKETIVKQLAMMKL